MPFGGGGPASAITPAIAEYQSTLVFKNVIYEVTPHGSVELVRSELFSFAT